MKSPPDELVRGQKERRQKEAIDGRVARDDRKAAGKAAFEAEWMGRTTAWSGSAGAVEYEGVRVRGLCKKPKRLLKRKVLIEEDGGDAERSLAESEFPWVWKLTGVCW